MSSRRRYGPRSPTQPIAVVVVAAGGQDRRRRGRPRSGRRRTSRGRRRRGTSRRRRRESPTGSVRTAGSIARARAATGSRSGAMPVGRPGHDPARCPCHRPAPWRGSAPDRDRLHRGHRFGRSWVACRSPRRPAPRVETRSMGPSGPPRRRPRRRSRRSRAPAPAGDRDPDADDRTAGEAGCRGGQLADSGTWGTPAMCTTGGLSLQAGASPRTPRGPIRSVRPGPGGHRSRSCRPGSSGLAPGARQRRHGWPPTIPSS